MLLSAVDLGLLEGLLTHRVLTTAQAARAADVTLRRANYRLGRLRDAGLVERTRPYASSGTAPHHWWLTTAGRTRMGAPGRIRTRSTSPLFLAHAAATAAVPLALKYLGPSVGLRLLTWLRDEESWESWMSSGGARRRITPDGYALVHVDEQDAAVPLLTEVDRTTMPLRRLVEKVNRYLQYCAEGAWRDRHPMCPVLLLLTTSEDRASNALAAAARERARILGPTGELFVGVSAAVNSADEAVTDAVWHSDHGDAIDDSAGVPEPETLSALLGYRICTERQLRANERAARAALETAELHALGERLARGARTFTEEDVGDPVAAEVLAALLRRSPDVVGSWAERHPVLVPVLAGWLAQPPPRPSLAEDSVQLLLDMRGPLWKTQAARARAAEAAAAAGDPRMRRACQSLAAGRLAPGWLLDGLAEPRSFRDWQTDLMRGYDAFRAEDVAFHLSLRPAWRRTPTAEQIGAECDAQNLLTCTGCGLHHQLGQRGGHRCACCGGMLVDYDPGRPREIETMMRAFLSET